MLMPRQFCREGHHPTWWKTSLLLAASSLLFCGCSTGHASSPFSMYSSPLLDGEMRAQRTQEATFHANTAPRQSRPADNTRPKPTQTQRPPATAPKTPGQAGPALATSSISSISSTPAHAANYVWTVYAANQITLPAEARSNIPTLYRTCRQDGQIFHTKPRVGDLAFFHNTFDANDDTRNNDWYTHVAIVENLTSAGQITLLGYQGKQLQRFRMNLEQVDTSTSPTGTVLNSEIRARNNQDAPFTQYLSSQLFAGYCSLLNKNQKIAFIDDWRPD